MAEQTFRGLMAKWKGFLFLQVNPYTDLAPLVEKLEGLVAVWRRDHLTRRCATQLQALIGEENKDV